MSASRYSRIHVIGISGSGKSALSRQIARTLDLPYSEMDDMFWRPGWTTASGSEFSTEIRQVVSRERWVLDGRQDFELHEVIGKRTQLLIWLDLPRHVVTYRALKRTLLRAAKREVLWAGNVEDWKLALRAWYRSSFRCFRQIRVQYSDLISRSYTHAAVVRLQSPRQVRAFLSQLDTNAVD